MKKDCYINILHRNIEERQGNLWAWDCSNPYFKNPIKMLDFEDKQTISAAMIKGAIQQLESRCKRNIEMDMEGVEVMSLQKNQKLLLEPITRVLCELMRVPPVEIPKEHLAEIKAQAEEFKSLEKLPKPTEIECNWEILARDIATVLQGNGKDLTEINLPSENSLLVQGLQQKPLIPFRRRS